MAKKKEDKEDSNSGVMIDASFIKDRPRDVLHVSPASDIGLGGGIPKGSWVIFSGKPKFGKSTKAIHCIAKFLKQFPDSKALYVDTEHRLKRFHLSHPLLDINRLQILQSQKGKILDAEEHLTQVELYIKDNPDSIIVIDSTSALCSSSEQIMDKISGDIRSKGPKILAHFCRKMASVVPVQDTIIIMITHLIANTSGYGSPYLEDSGNKIQYQSDVKLRGKSVEKWEDKETQIGQIISWNVEWAALGPPGQIIKNYFRYNNGIDETMELIEQAINFGMITKGGAWFTCDFMSELGELPQKAQGQEKLHQLISSDQRYIDCLQDQIKTTI